jgi:hypothetical protein
VKPCQKLDVETSFDFTYTDYKMTKRIKYHCLVFILIALIISCIIRENKYSNALSGEWQIEKLLQGNKDYGSDETYIMSFDSPNKLWLHNLSHDKKVSLTSNYGISHNADLYVMDITECNDENINGNYTIHIDTIQDDGESHLIRLILISEKTYIQAKRFKLKHYLPPN